jgi:hypothetical protein
MLLGHIIHCWHGFCNFSHAQQGQLLPMSGAQTVGVGGIRICAGRMVDPIDCPVCQTTLGGDLTSYYSVEGAAFPQPASFGESGIAALIGAPLANRGPAKAPLMVMAWFNILRFVVRQQPVVSCVEKICF